jgi:hypothetical protein
MLLVALLLPDFLLSDRCLMRYSDFCVPYVVSVTGIGYLVLFDEALCLAIRTLLALICLRDFAHVTSIFFWAGCALPLC